MKKSLLLLITSLILSTITFASFPVFEKIIIDPCDNIILKNGDEISAKIIEITTDIIKYKKCDYLDGPLISISKSEILMIRYANGDKDIFSTTSSENYNINKIQGDHGQSASFLSITAAVFGLFILGLPLGIIAFICGLASLRKENPYLAVGILGMILGLVEIIIMVGAL